MQAAYACESQTLWQLDRGGRPSQSDRKSAVYKQDCCFVRHLDVGVGMAALARLAAAGAEIGCAEHVGGIQHALPSLCPSWALRLQSVAIEL